jgi:urease accessory protein
MSASLERAGWQAHLSLRFARLEGRTQLVHRAHRGPLMVQRPFHPEGAPCHVYLIHPPGGVVGGDQVQLEAYVAPGAHALLTTPGAGKFYRRGVAPPARVGQILRIEQGTLEWLPQENIYYPDAEVEVSTQVHLHGMARFIGWEMACLGLPSRAATLEAGCVRQRLELWRDGKPLWMERTTLDAERLRSRTGARGDPALGVWLAHPATALDLDGARAALAVGDGGGAGTSLACTLVDGTLICRGHASRMDRLRGAFTRLWQVLRPSLIGLAAVPPRIWAT